MDESKIAVIGKDNVGGASTWTRATWTAHRPRHWRLEALGYLNIQLGYMLTMGTQIGFTLVR